MMDVPICHRCSNSFDLSPIGGGHFYCQTCQEEIGDWVLNEETNLEMIQITHFEIAKMPNNDIQTLRQAVLDKEKLVIEMSRRPLYYASEITKTKIVIAAYRRLIRIHEAKGGQTLA